MEKMRLVKFLAAGGVASRRRAEVLIGQGKVTVNGAVVTDPATAVSSYDRIKAEGRIVTLSQRFVYYALNKPRGYVSTVEDPNATKKVVDLVPPKPRVFPVGRLDRESEGLIILTNDGDLALKLTHPRYEHEKEYRVIVAFRPDRPRTDLYDAARRLAAGILLEEGKTSPCIAEVVREDTDGGVIRMVLKEGKKRQIRRMCTKLNLDVKRLVRTKVGLLELGYLKPGKFIRVRREDIL